VRALRLGSRNATGIGKSGGVLRVLLDKLKYLRHELAYKACWLPQLSRSDDRAADDRYQAELMNPGNRIVVDSNFGAHDRPDHIEGSIYALSRSRASCSRGDGGGQQDVRVHRRLSSI